MPRNQENPFPAAPAFFSKSVQRLRALKNNPALLPLWIRYQSQSRMGLDPVLKIFGFEFSGFFDFNAFVGSYHYRPDAKELSFISNCCSNAEYVIDIGANMGVMSCLFGRSTSLGAVHSFEPHPVTFASLEKNINRNNLSNVQCHNFAVGKTTGMVSFTNHSSPASNRVGKGANSIQVAMTTLDEFSEVQKAQRIDFLKIDVEGAELDVLEGAHRLFKSQAVGSGLIEICPGNLNIFGVTVDNIIDWLDGVGYELREINNEGLPGPLLPRGLDDPDILLNAAIVSSVLCENKN